MNHWFLIQTECCNYTVRNWRTFSGFAIGEFVHVMIKNDHAYLKFGNQTAKEKILRAEQRSGYDPLLVVVWGPDDLPHRVGDPAQLPDNWDILALDTSGHYQFPQANKRLPEGYRTIHAIPGQAIPPIVTVHR